MLKPLLRGALALALITAAVLPASAQQLWKWSTTAATNATVDSAINWATGMAPSAVSPSSRAMMAAVARYRNDVAGAITSTGTASAYAVTSNSSVSATPPDGYRISFIPHATNAANASLAVDGGTAFAIQSAIGFSNIPAGVLVQGTPYTAVFKAASSVWGIHGYFGNPAGLPIGAVLTYTGVTAPTANFAMAYGQAISRTTYATLFALVGTTYGVGDGSTTFNLPDARGRFIAGLDNMGGSAANRITVAGGNYDGTVNGGTGGAQNQTIAQGNLPAVTWPKTLAVSNGTLAGTIGTLAGTLGTLSISNTMGVSDTRTWITSNNLLPSGGVTAPGAGGITGAATAQQAVVVNGGSISLTGSTALTGAPSLSGAPGLSGSVALGGDTTSGGSGTALPTIPPAISLPMIIRIL